MSPHYGIPLREKQAAIYIFGGIIEHCLRDISLLVQDARVVVIPVFDAVTAPTFLVIIFVTVFAFAGLTFDPANTQTLIFEAWVVELLPTIVLTLIFGSWLNG